MTVPGQGMQINMIENFTTMCQKEWPSLEWNQSTQINMSRYHLQESIRIKFIPIKSGSIFMLFPGMGCGHFEFVDLTQVSRKTI